VSTPVSSDSEPEQWVSHDHSSETLSLGSDVNISAIFKSLSVNMISNNHLEHEDKDKTEEMIQLHTNHWIKYLNTLWDISFKHCELPTVDKVIQINLGNEANSKRIFISENLSLSEKEDLICLIQEYINIFAWNYEDMPRFGPQVVMHRLNINPDAKPVKQQQRKFYPEIMEVIESEDKKLIDSGFVRKE